MRVQNSLGFSLIELMITVAVVGILAAIAYPSYQDHVRKARRADAKSALLDAAQRQERFYTENNQYTSVLVSATGCTNTAAKITATPATDCGLNLSETTTDGYYKLTVNAPLTGTAPNQRRNTYTITATPATGKSQTQDSSCGAFTLNQTGVKCVEGGTYCSNGDTSAKDKVTACW